MVIISASGMCEGGRVLHHLANNLRYHKNIILFTGYQAENTLGRKILEGEPRVRIYNRMFQVRAQIEVLNELSAHADQPELIEYMQNIKGLKDVYLVHGEAGASKDLKKKLAKDMPKLKVHVPCQDEKATF